MFSLTYSGPLLTIDPKVASLADLEAPDPWDTNDEKVELLGAIYGVALKEKVLVVPEGITLDATTYVEDKVVWVSFAVSNASNADVGTTFITTDYNLGLDTADSNAVTYIQRACDFINGKLTFFSA